LAHPVYVGKGRERQLKGGMRKKRGDKRGGKVGATWAVASWAKGNGLDAHARGGTLRCSSTVICMCRSTTSRTAGIEDRQGSLILKASRKLVKSTGFRGECFL